MTTPPPDFVQRRCWCGWVGSCFLIGVPDPLRPRTWAEARRLADLGLKVHQGHKHPSKPA